MTNDKPTILPQNEYYHRFAGTSHSDMSDPEYYGTYPRSADSRYISKGKQKEVKYQSQCVKTEPKGINSLHAHTGCYRHPFKTDQIRQCLTLNRYVEQKDHKDLHGELLRYKRSMAQLVKTAFEKEADGNIRRPCSSPGSKRNKKSRPMVIYENNYPCVLVDLLPYVLSREEEYKLSLRKPMQNLLLAGFIAYMNNAANEAGIPIEMVFRQSFGHNLPSVGETDHTFRINVGLVPQSYAQLLGETLYNFSRDLSNSFQDMTRVLTAHFSESFQNNYRRYNVQKLKQKIDDKAKQFNELNELKQQLEQGDRDYQQAFTDINAFNRLYGKFTNANQRAGKDRNSAPPANFRPILPDLLDKKPNAITVWEAIRQRGNPRGDSLLSECFRRPFRIDWFINQIMLNFDNAPERPIEAAIQQLTSYLELKMTDSGKSLSITMDDETIKEELSQQRCSWQFNQSSFANIFDNDQAFKEIMTKLFAAFGEKLPKESLYAHLEQRGLNFVQNARAQENENDLSEHDDQGSDSECDIDIAENEQESGPVKHAKFRVPWGMKALTVAEFGLMHYLYENGYKSYLTDRDYTYYEEQLLEPCLKKPQFNNIGPQTRNKSKNHDQATMATVLVYDLNHCNAKNLDKTPSLVDKLAEYGNTPPQAVILDNTSSDIVEELHAFKTCFTRGVSVVLMANSGLKHNQGGIDALPYGTVRIIAKNSDDRDRLMRIMVEDGLSKEDGLPQMFHEKVRANKKVGLENSYYAYFNTTASQKAVTQEKKYRKHVASSSLGK